MDFGRIENLEQVDFTLPADHPGIAKVLGGKPSAVPKVYVGGVLWASDSFPGTIYPPKARPADFVKHYTQQFNTIELNATYYRMQSAETFQRWANTAPAGFKFCPKVHQDISHANDLLSVADLHRQHSQLLQALGDTLGTVFLQLPPHFSPGRFPELVGFLEQNSLPGMALELRHAGWFSNTEALNALCNVLYKKGLGLLFTDTPGRRDVLHMRLTGKTAFVRFNAHNDHFGDEAQIDAWIDKANHWFSLGLENFIFLYIRPASSLCQGW
jgi:uncharacterized protein YecE (DUF72 family)